jgi:hypothetical protein
VLTGVDTKIGVNQNRLGSEAFTYILKIYHSVSVWLIFNKRRMLASVVYFRN